MGLITVNGAKQEVNLPLLLTELIKLNNILQPEMVSIQINGEFIDRELFETISIQEGDEVDFLYFMGGGK